MKKLFLCCALVVCGVISTFATDVTIELSCDIEVEMEYEEDATLADVIHDALILEEYFCGE